MTGPRGQSPVDLSLQGLPFGHRWFLLLERASPDKTPGKIAQTGGLGPETGPKASRARPNAFLAVLPRSGVHIPGYGRTATMRKPMWSCPPLGFKPESKGGSAGPALVCPAPAPANPGHAAIPIHQRRGPCGIQIGIHTARSLRMMPVSAPLEHVAVHVVQAPGVGRVAPDRSGPLQRRPDLGTVVRLALEVRLLAAQHVAERGAVVVPARQAYSHWASVGRRTSHSVGRSPAARALSVSFRQNPSASAKLTV